MDFERLSDDWLGANELIVFGFGRFGSRHLPILMEDFDIAAIIDNDMNKADTIYKGIHIINFQQIKDKLAGHKIIIMSSVSEICRSMETSLEEVGLKKFIDFCRFDRFVTEWYWRKKNQVRFMQVDTAVTTRCTFNCKNCNMFIPYYGKKEKVNLENIKETLSLFFLYVDYVYLFSIVGGEPFIADSLQEILLYICCNFGKKIGHIKITTNGTVIPSEEILKIIKNYHIEVRISDYTAQIEYRSKLDRVVDTLAKHSIDYQVMPDLKWKDFGFPATSCCYENVREHMMTCGTTWRGLADKKLYYCNVAWSAEKAGLFKLEADDYMDLSELRPEESDRKRITAFNLGCMEKGYLSFCRVCAGCGTDNNSYVSAGLQL